MGFDGVEPTVLYYSPPVCKSWICHCEYVIVDTEVEFQYGGSLFSETGSSNISSWIEKSGRNLVCS